jgi:hypothetical protein
MVDSTDSLIQNLEGKKCHPDRDDTFINIQNTVLRDTIFS